MGSRGQASKKPNLDPEGMTFGAYLSLPRQTKNLVPGPGNKREEGLCLNSGAAEEAESQLEKQLSLTTYHQGS